MDNEVAAIIIQQLGNRALSMLGARDLVAGKTSLTFKIGRNSKSVSHISIWLQPSDTYDVEAIRVRKQGGVPVRHIVGSVEDVYAEGLHQVIESLTGMATSL
jgi:hypothetical protein